jgi:hypothetical protein
MRKQVFSLIAFVLFLNGYAQIESSHREEWRPDFYIGFQSGLESFTGLIGITGDLRLYNNFYFHIGAGIGSWGGKLSAGIRNEKSAGKGVGYGIYISRAGGLSDFTTQLETTTGTKDVKLDLLEGYTINPTVSYKWVTGKGHRFFLEGGYAVPLQDNPWKIKDGSTLTDTSKRVLKILSPGGLSLGLGFQFAL